MFFPEMDELQSERKHRCAQPSDANCLFGTQMDFVNAFEDVINKHVLSSCIGMRIRFVQVNQQISMHISTVKSAHSNEQIEIILCRGGQQDCNITNFDKAPMQHSCSWPFVITIHVIMDVWLSFHCVLILQKSRQDTISHLIDGSKEWITKNQKFAKRPHDDDSMLFWG